MSCVFYHKILKMFKKWKVWSILSFCLNAAIWTEVRIEDPSFPLKNLASVELGREHMESGGRGTFSVLDSKESMLVEWWQAEGGWKAPYELVWLSMKGATASSFPHRAVHTCTYQGLSRSYHPSTALVQSMKIICLWGNPTVACWALTKDFPGGFWLWHSQSLWRELLFHHF